MYLQRALVAALSGISLLAQSATAHSTQRRSLSHASQIDDAVIHTPSHRVHTLSSFDLTFGLHDRGLEIRFALSPNHDILSEDAAVQIMEPDGTTHSEPIDRFDHRIYRGDAFARRRGSAEWTNAGWARIAIHRDGAIPLFEGAFRVDGDHHHIQSAGNYKHTGVVGDPAIEDLSEDSMVVWRDSDISGMGYGELKRDLAEQSTCSSDVLSFNMDDAHPVYRSLDARADPEETSLWSMSTRALFGRQIDGTTGGNGAGVNLVSTIGSSEGCPTTRKVALLGIATDCTYTAQFKSQSDLRTNIIQQINSASQLYESTFNISLGIQNLTISSAACPTTPPAQAEWNIACSDSVTITDRLNLFSKWRGQFDDSNAYWTLLTTCNTKAAVGLAWLGQVCVQGAQTASAGDGNETIAAANVVVRTSTEWQVIAHETGHTFGAVHDCTDMTCGDGTVTKQQCCPLSKSTCNADGQFIMNPSTGSGITKFSPCSIGNICSAIGRNSVKIGCLTNNRDVSTITGSQCGNGIVENGEDCDCGGTSGCADNPCCDPKTCKFTAKSACDPSNEECCTTECQFASNGTVCRPSTGTCDPEETCAGNTALCPKDVTAPDGKACGDSGANLQCSSGQCTSRDLQCRTLMGSLTASNDTYACSSQGCQLSCASPEFGANTCLTMQQNFLDGTGCEGGGKCSNGLCQGSTVGNQIAEWVRDNKVIVIPVATVAGGLVLFAVGGCIVSAFRRRNGKIRGSRGSGGRRGGPGGLGSRIRSPRQQQPMQQAAQPPPGWNSLPSAFVPGQEPPPGAVPMPQQARSAAHRHRRNGQGGGPPPAGPPQQDGQFLPPVRRFSTRYA